MELGVAVVGLVIGTLVGMTGVGGGALLTPMLILVVGTPPVIAVGTDLVANGTTKVIGAIQHLRQRTVELRLALYMALGSVPGAVLGVLALKLAQDNLLDVNRYTKQALGVILVLAAAAMLLRLLWRKRAAGREESSPLTLGPRQRLLTVIFGFVMGLVVGMTSVGSGSLIVVALIFIYRLNARQVVGTDVFHAALLVSAGALAHFAVGNVDLHLAGNLLIGAVPGVIIGSRVTLKLPEPLLRGVVATALVLAGVKLL